MDFVPVQGAVSGEHRALSLGMFLKLRIRGLRAETGRFGASIGVSLEMNPHSLHG